MARRTFGRSGQPIEIPSRDSDDVGTTLTISEFDTGTERVDDSSVAIADSGVEDNAGIDFEPVGEPLRTEPINTVESSIYTDPATVTGKRPRKPRGPNKPKEPSTANTRVVTLNLEKVLFSLHTMAAATLQEPELCIDEDEAKILAEAVEKVANAYNFSAMFSPKTQAGVDLCIALVTVYGHRVMKIARRPGKIVRNVTPIDKAQ